MDTATVIGVVMFTVGCILACVVCAAAMVPKRAFNTKMLEESSGRRWRPPPRTCNACAGDIVHGEMAYYECLECRGTFFCADCESSHDIHALIKYRM